MTEISRSALFGKLNSLAYKAIEGAIVADGPWRDDRKENAGGEDPRQQP